MLKARRQAATVVTAKLHSAEAALSRVLIEVAELVGVTESASIDANLSMIVCRGPAQHTIQCLAALGAAREALVRAHEEFAVSHESIGLGPVAFGAGGGAKPQAGSTPAPNLSVAA